MVAVAEKSKGKRRPKGKMPSKAQLVNDLSHYKGLYEATLEEKKCFDEISVESEKVLAESLAFQKMLREAQLKYRETTQQVLSLNTDLDTVNKLNAKNQEKIIELDSVIEQLSILDSKLTVELSLKSELKNKFKKITKDNLKIRLASNEKNIEIQQLRIELSQKTKAISALKNTLSFQLGHTIIFAFKSWKSFFSLPLDLLKIRKQSSGRKDTKKERECLISTFESKIEPKLLKNEEELLNKLTLLDSDSDYVDMLKNMRVACIMDEFSYSSYSPECNLLQLSPKGFKEEIESFEPQVLFIESAWRGKSGLWGNKVGHVSEEVVDLVSLCKAKGIPTLFWNKEDPVHFETFLNTAKLFDYVFSTDIDCISRYKGALGHDRVYFLPFAAQPKVNNPIEKFERKDSFCFAGAYYLKYPARTKDLGNFLINLPEYRPVDIYDRNYGKDDPNHMFPAEYQPYIIGTLPFEEIEKAYKGYNYAINLNSIKQSQSMFARRVYELLASNTLTISNFSRGLKLMFGDLVFTSDSGEEIIRKLNNFNQNPINLRKLRLAGLRKVLSDHTYQDRFAYVISKISNTPIEQLLPKINVISYVKSEEALQGVLNMYKSQSYTHKSLTLVVPQGMPINTLGISDKEIKIVSVIESRSLVLKDLGFGSDWLATFVAEDYYGKDYLTDLALATRYYEGSAIGKATYFEAVENSVRLVQSGLTYQLVNRVKIRSSIVKVMHELDTTVSDWIGSIYTREISTGMPFSIDEFSYCKNGAAIDITKTDMADINDLDLGYDLKSMQKTAESALPVINQLASLNKISAEHLANDLIQPKGSSVVFETLGGVLQISSTLADGHHVYLYSKVNYALSDLDLKNNTLLCNFDSTPGLNLQFVIVFLDSKNEKINHVIHAANKNIEIEVPSNAEFIKLGLRVYASGVASTGGFLLEHKKLTPIDMLSRNKALIVTNHYPAYENLYRNGFIHSRVRAYKELGERVDVFKLRADENVVYEEFEGVDVSSGGADVLTKMLSSGIYKHVLVHFLDKDMWDILTNFIDDIKVTVWVHGAEVQPFHRREYNYINSPQKDIDVAKAQSEERLKFWRSVLKKPHKNLELVFVSQYFANEVMEDLGLELNNNTYQVIHNPIDTGIFNYISKDIEQRKKILSIRPYASAKYANDLSVNAILELSKEPFFSELEFKMIGDGQLFEETLAPISHFDNVIIERGFLQQSEIAALHKEYGIFLTPTRMDAQGVSRDEAMSSGLIPVTNAVTAIPEFVDDDCGILAPGDDYLKMAEGIKNIYYNPEIFLEMSKKASDRVGCQSSNNIVISREILQLKKIRLE